MITVHIRVIGKTTDGPISRYINRKISTRITYLIIRYRIPISPNQVSLISFLLGVLAGLLYLVNAVIAGILVQISSIIDGVDGELARALNKTSKIGGFIDAILDRITDIAIIIGLTFYTYNLNIINPSHLTLLAMLALSADIMVSYLHARGEASLGVHPLKIGSTPSIASRDVRLFIIFLLSLLGTLYPILYPTTLIIISMLGYLYVTLKSIELYMYYRR